VGDDDPEGQYDPGRQGRLHGVGRVAVVQYVPAVHSVQLGAPARLYFPEGHTSAVGVVDPATQKYPAAHGPLHTDDVSLATKPYRPAGQGPLHATVDKPLTSPYVPAWHGAVQDADVRAVVDPYSPALQFVHTPDPGTL
jgi:hypothetical protein